MTFRAKAPLRISFCGGGTDVSPYPEEKGGAVLSTTIDKYAWASVTPRTDDRILITSLDFDLQRSYLNRLIKELGAGIGARQSGDHPDRGPEGSAWPALAQLLRYVASTDLKTGPGAYGRRKK